MLNIGEYSRVMIFSFTFYEDKIIWGNIFKNKGKLEWVAIQTNYWYFKSQIKTLRELY